MEPQERHYDINKLNVIFAITSFILALSLIWLFGDDYARSWKKYQKEFRDLEIEKTRVKYDAATQELEKNAEYILLEQQRDEAKKEFDSNCSHVKEIESVLKKLMAENDLHQQSLQFKKAELDAAHFRLEEAGAHHPENVLPEEVEFTRLRKDVEKYKTLVEESDQKIQEKNQVLSQCTEKLKEIDRKERLLAKHVLILDRKLAKIDPLERGFVNQIADIVRDLPVFDLANPQFKIEQVVLKDLTDDVNFMQVPKVERCITCHLGINNPEYKDASQPFKTHPNLEMFVANYSPHPLEEMGCTVCHEGRGRGTDFISSAHTPNSEAQAKIWEEKYNWQELHHWEKTMLPKSYVEAGCFKCHSNETTIKGAEKLNLGLNLIEKTGCYGCHNIDKYSRWPKTGPDLTKISSKITKEWAYRWIADPQSFRHSTWMPSFFNQSNTNDPESMERTNQEIHAIVHYLFEMSQEFTLTSMPQGEINRGKEIVASVGCFACHETESKDEQTTRDTLRKRQGPNFVGLGSKTSQAWIFNWLKNPSRYHPGTKMPNLRLTDQEASDAATYLASLVKEEFNATSVPSINLALIDQMVLDLLTKNTNTREAKTQIAQMSLEERLSFSGKKLIRQYGCFGCHNIKGFENEKPIGTDLTEEGSKSPDRLDFGFIDIERKNYAWFEQKLKNPRIFDQGKIKAHDEKLKMPNFHFTEEEIEAITTALLGFVDEKPQLEKVINPSLEKVTIQQGQQLIREFNCQACHTIEGEGATIQESVQNWLIEYGGRSDQEALAVIKSFSPPNLIGEGKKVQSEWLFDFLHEPKTIRPWLKVRMPTYNLNASHLNALLKYFNALDKQEFPFADLVDTSLTEEESQAAEKLFSAEYLDCVKCHIVGDKLPPGSADSWAPNFALVQERLKPQWILEWLKNPQDLLPGTKMPTYFDPTNFEASGPEDILGGNELEQIRVLRNYLMTLSDHQAPKNEILEPPPAPPLEGPAPTP